MEQELTLKGGRTTAGVVRIGDTVRRPIKARAAHAHKLLCHLESRGFDGAPKFLGIDSMGREVLSFVPGSVPPELAYFSDEQLIAAARLLRQFHDATLDCPVRDGYEVVCHGDASPCNCVFVDGVPKAFIDFDDVHPGSRLEDLGYAAWLWIDIGNEDLSIALQAHRVVDFFRAYGIASDDAVAAIIAAQLALAERTSIASVREWSNSCRAWIERNRDELSVVIAARSNKTIQPTCEDARG